MSFAIWCFLIGESNIFKVKIDPTDDVADLTQKIKGQKQALKEIDADHLTLYLVTVDASLTKEPRRNELNRLSKNLPEDTELDADDVLSADIYNSPPEGKKYIILVRSPEAPTTTGSQLVQAGAVGTYIEELVFHADQTGTNHVNKSTLERNRIREGTRNHLAYKQIQQALAARRSISQEHREHLAHLFGNGVDDYFEVDGDSGRPCSGYEIYHYFDLFDERTSALDSNEVKHKVNDTFLGKIARYLSEWYGSKAVFNREVCWPLHFVAQVGASRFRYEPRSDYLFSLDACPRINFEVGSEANHRDRYRMLLQAGLLVRVVNKLTLRTGNSFVAVAIYITKGFIAEWYFVYQVKLEEDKIAYFKDGEFNLGTFLDRFLFFHRLYNIPSAISDQELPTIGDELSNQKQKVSNQGYKGFTGRTKRTARSNAPPSGNDPIEIDNSPTDQMFVNAEYEVLPEIKLEEGWAPLDPLPSTVRCARGPGNIRVILKIVEPDEYKIHSLLASIRSPDNHTIPILLDIPRGVGKLIATQQETVLSAALYQLPKTKGRLLARQFLEGVHFMHENYVAHLDLKPDNIVVAMPTNQLFIIDFGVAVQVSGPESRIKGYRGTEGWAAPEVEVNSDTGYQPIQADLWSTGQVLKYIADHQSARTSSIIYPLAERLMNSNPTLRPSPSTILELLIFKPKKKHNADPLMKEELNPVRIVFPESLNSYCVLPLTEHPPVTEQWAPETSYMAR